MSNENENGAPADGDPTADGGGMEMDDDGFTPVTNKKTTGAPAKTPVQKAIENRGNNQIETSENLITQIKLEFNISKDTKTFNPRVKHLEVLKLMKAMDPTLVVKSAHDDTEWDSLVEFPRNADYQKHFNLKDSKPPRGARKVIAHFKLHTKTKINAIKYSTEVWNYLKANSIYLVIDHYEMQKIASIGYITMVHPTLTWLPTLTEDLTFAMQQAHLPRNDIEEWQARTKHTYDEEVNDAFVPNFHLSKKDYAFGNGKLRIATTVLQVNCPVDDAKYLKTLMSDTFLNKYMERGTFIPSGLHLITDTATLKQKLSDHNVFLAECENIPIVGLPPAAFEIPVEYALSTMFQKSDLFTSVQLTSRSNDLGKHFLLTTKAKSEQAKLWLDTVLPQWTDEFVPEEMKIPNFDRPRRTVLSAMSPAIANYARALQEQSAYAGDEEYNRTAPSVHRKKRRQEVTMAYGDNDFPALSNKQSSKNQASNNQNKEQSNNQMSNQNQNANAATETATGKAVAAAKAATEAAATTKAAAATAAAKSAKALETAEALWKNEMEKSTTSFGKRVATLNKALDAKLDIQQERLNEQQNRVQAQLEQAIATTDMLRAQVDTMQQGMTHLQRSVDAILQKLDGQQANQHQGSQPPTAAYGAPGTFGTPVQGGGMQPPPLAYGAGTVTPQGQGQFSSPSRTPTSLQAASQMQLLNPGYNPRFMTQMYNPVNNMNIQGQYSQQQPAGSTPTNNMESSPSRVAV